MSQMIKPPRWAQRLLCAFAAPKTVEEVDGDLEELFVLWTQAHGIRKAQWIYIRTVFTLLRPFSRRKPQANPSMITISMLQSYFTMSWRTLLKNKMSAMINIGGLSLGLSTSIIILLVVMDELKYDTFHSHLPNIYAVMQHQSTNDGISTGDATPGPVAEVLRKDYPEVEFVARVAGFGGQRILVDSKISYESGIYADPDLFNMMTFKTLEGHPAKVLESGSSAVITRDMARKLFGDQNAVGKSFVFNKRHSITVGAVVENVPSHSSIRFDMVLPFSLFEKENEWLKKWDDNRIMTWMQLQPNSNIQLLEKKMTTLLQERSNEKTVSLFAYPLSQYHLHNSFDNGKPAGGRITAVYMLTGFGAFMLLIACINFMNIATAQSEYRAREVGVRKALGATRKLIIFQFLNESFTITFLSLIGAIGLTLLIIPPFNAFAHASIAFDFTNTSIWGLTLCITCLTAILAGSYPALFLSRFLPAKVLKGRTVNRSGGGLRKMLVTFQFVISGFFLIGTIIMYAQFDHVRNRPIGYEQANLINVRIDSTLSAKFAYLKEEFLKLPGIVSVTGSSDNILYSSGSVTGMDWPGKRAGEELSIVVGEIEYDWTKTMDVQITQGRDFDPARASDVTACLLNESAVTKMGLKNPVGSVVGGHEVIGIFKNYVYNNPFGSISPMSYTLNRVKLNHLYLRVKNDSEWREALSRVESTMKGISPEFVFDFSFTKDEYQNHFEEIADTSLMITLFGSMTIFISCLGLFGLAGFVAEKRSKEMSIRKVFGASMIRVLTALSNDFLRPVIYALIIVVPASVFIARWALSNISYRVDLNWWMFASAAAATLTIACMVVFYHGWRTAVENPIVRLRDE